MGKVIAKKIRGMNLWAKVALTLLFTLTLSVFMYEGWYKPMQAQAAAVRYDVWPDTAAGSVGTDGNITFTTAVGTATSYTATGTVNSARAMLMSGQTLATSIRNRFAGVVSTTAGWEFFRAYTPTYTTANNAISANVAVNVRYYVRTAGTGTAQIIAELYEYNDTTGIVGAVKGTFTSTAFSITATTTGADVTGNFGNGAFTVAPGNRLQVRFFVKPSAAQTVGSVAILWGSTSTTTPAGSTYITPTEGPGADTTPPTVSSVAVNSGTTVNVTFSEAMGTGVTTASNYTLSGTGKGSLANNPNSVALVSGNTYRLTWTAGEMLNGGNITITVANAQDAAGNAIGSPNSGTHTGGGVGVAPTVIINQASPGQADPTSTSPINFTVTFSEATTNFATGDVNLSGSAGATTATVTGSGTTYNVAVSGMTTSGTVTASIPANVATDAVGNNNTASTSTDNSVTYNLVTVTNDTTAGALTFSGNTSNQITVTAPFTGDDDVDNSCVIRWGTVSGTYPNTATSSKVGNSYTATVSGLNQSTTYYFQATFTDPDGVTGSPVTGSSATTVYVNPLMHSGANLGTKYSGGTWGAGKDCTWCHGAGSNNIKKIKAQIDTPSGVRNVTFSIVSAVKSDNSITGVFGNDNRTYAVNASTNVCEVCHHQTSYHQYSSSKIAAGSKNHNDANNGDCIVCHSHSAGFKGAGGHAIPRYATTDGHTGCATGVGCHANTNPLAPYPTTPVNGSYPAPDCRACHKLADPTVASNGCGSCHGALNGNGQPNSNVYPNISGAHTRHVALLSCTSCHDVGGTGGNADHGPSNRIATGTVNLASSLGATGTNNTLTCGTTYCHSQGTNFASPASVTSPAWTGGTTNCASCHTGGTSTGPSYPNNAPKANSHERHVVGNAYNCAVCHYAVTTNGTTITTPANHVNQQYNVNPNTAEAGSFSYTYNATGGTCSATICHGAGVPKWGANLGSVQCAKCHSTTTTPAASFTATNGTTTGVTSTIHVSHINATHGMRYAITCAECHSIPASPTAAHFTATGDVMAPMTGVAATHEGALVTTYVEATKSCTTWCHGDGLTGGSRNPNWSTTLGFTGVLANDCTKCHGFPPASAKHANANLDGSGGKQPCNQCHKNLSTSGVFANPAEHVNGKVEGGDCLGCHEGAASTSRAAITTQFSAQSHHVQGRAVTNADCYQCHMEAGDTSGAPDSNFHVGVENSNAAVNLVVWNGASRGYISYTANGQRSSIKKVNDHCLSCHNTTQQNAGFAPFVAGSTTDRYSPEARLATPKTNTSILSRYSSTRTIAWSSYLFNNNSGAVAKFGTNQKNRVTKALSAHGNAVKNQFPQWDATANGRGDDEVMADAAPANLSANRNVFCYDCHNSHGSNATGVTSSYSSATGRNKGGLLKTTEAGKGGYTVTYTPAGRDITYRNVSGLGQAAWASITNKNPINGTPTYTMNPGASLCNDCHNDDTRKVNIQKPWSITNTYSSSKAIVGYWSTPYFDNYTMYPAKRTTYKMGGTANTGINDRRKPMGGHYGTSVSTRSAGHAGSINGLCTPCHDPHGVSNALGNAGAGTAKAGKDYGVPLLKGTWVTSPYREDKATPTVKRGGGRNFTGLNNAGAVPGYHIDQNTFLSTPAPFNGGAAVTTSTSQKRSQRFRSITIMTNMTSAATATNMPNYTGNNINFAGICTECHRQVDLTGSATATTSKPWKTKERIHQSVSGWGATNGTNSANRVHAYTCSKCHAPHVSRLPRLLVTNCLDARHYGKQVSTSIASVSGGTTTPGNINQSILTSSALGAGRFPGGGSRYSAAPASAQNPGGWWFQTNGAAGTAQPSAASYGSNCHNAAGAGGATYSPTNQRWNNKSVW